MIDHGRARELASARFDGELDALQERDLIDHLETCDACSTFVRGLDELSAVTRSLPRETAPSIELPAELPVRAGRRRALLPALAAAIVLAVFAVVLQPAPTFKIRKAEAAEALAGIETMYVERVIERYEEGRGDKPFSRVTEKIWFRAPGFVRIESRGFHFDESVNGVLIEVPGRRYSKGLNSGDGAQLSINIPPDRQGLPEPLTSTVAFIGRRIGPGPVIAGRKTIRFEALVDGSERTVFVDADRFTELGSDPEVVLGKADQAMTTIKTTRGVRYNEPIDQSLFEIPEVIPDVVEPLDEGFRQGPAFAGPVGKPVLPEGVELVTSGSVRDPDSGSITTHARYGKGALRILVSIGDITFQPDDSTRQVRVSGREALLFLGLYGEPTIQFAMNGTAVSVRAPLPPDELVDLAAQMFPRKE